MKNKKNIILILLSLLLIIIDQTIKILVYKNLFCSEITVIKGLLNITYVENTGGAFGFGSKNIIIFITFTIILVAFLIGLLIKKINEYNMVKKISIIMIISGGIGNLIDRIFRGFVIDYIDINQLFEYPMFNFADICIVLGCIIFAICLVFNKEKYERIYCKRK